jgi:hypothetical protein
MKRVLVVVTGIVGGVLVAGMLSPMIMPLVPQRLRAAGMLWVAMAVVVAATVSILWWVLGRRRD